MCNLTEVKNFFKPRLHQIAVSMIIAGILFWAGWMQFGDLNHNAPIIIAWNLLLGGTGIFVGEVVAILLIKAGIVKVRTKSDYKNDGK